MNAGLVGSFRLHQFVGPIALLLVQSLLPGTCPARHENPCKEDLGTRQTLLGLLANRRNLTWLFIAYTNGREGSVAS